MEMPFGSFKPSLNKRLIPVLRPSGSGFDSLATYNPTIINLSGCLYLLYRGRTRSTRHTGTIGLATSPDGFHWTKHPSPIVSPDTPYDRLGCEDPRVVKIGDTCFMTYTGVSEWVSERLWTSFWTNICFATSKDLMRWKKEKPIVLKVSPNRWHSQNFKAATLLPIPFKGYWTMFFTGELAPQKVAIGYAFSKDFRHWQEGTDSPILLPRKGYFDSQVVEVGSTPIVTEEGILMIYNGKDYSTYRVGAALLSPQNIAQVLWRSEKPILEPTLIWEREGVTPQVTFANGFICCEGKWNLYYGAADKVIGVASEGITYPLPDKDTEKWVEQSLRQFQARHPIPQSISLKEWKDELLMTAWVAAIEAQRLFDERYGVPKELFVRQRIWNSLKELWRSERKYETHTTPLEEQPKFRDGEDEGSDWQELLTDPKEGEMIDRLLVRGAVARLPERERKVIECLFWEGETLGEVAKDLGVSVVMVHKLKEKALDRLREWLQGMGAEKVKKRQQ